MFPTTNSGSCKHLSLFSYRYNSEDDKQLTEWPDTKLESLVLQGLQNFSKYNLFNQIKIYMEL